MSKPEYTFEDFVEEANWNDATQAGVMFEFISEKGLKDAFDSWLSERYRFELESDDLVE